MTKRRLRHLCKTGIPGYDPWRDGEGFGFDVERALLAVEFFPATLKHCKGAMAGKPFVLSDWQAAIVGNLFGWYRPDGTRRYRYTLIYVPRKNGKTALAAGLVILLLFTDGEPGAEIYGAASEYKQACLVFDHVHGMVRQNDELRSSCKMYLGQAKAVQLVDDPLSVYKVIAHSPEASHGGNTHAAVIDELHTFPNRELVDVLNTSKGSRRQPLTVYLTTADYEREVSICNDVHDQAKNVRDGLNPDPTFLPVIYEADKSDDWKDRRVWKKSNPNLGTSVYESYLDEQLQIAKATPGFENTFKRLHLNIRTEQAERWLTIDEWDGCGERFDPGELRGQRCWMGLDLGYASDLTALCAVFPHGDMGFKALWWFWMPRNKAIEMERKKGIRYAEWSRTGYIKLTADDETDYNLIREDVVAITKQYRPVEVAMDRAFQGVQLSHDLHETHGLPVVAFGQGFMSMAAPTAEFGRLVRRGEFLHNNNPILRWMIGGLSVDHDAAGNMKPNKANSGSKIDGVVAAIMALGRAMDSPRQKQPLYASRGPVVVTI